MTKEEILKLNDREFREWIARLNKERKFKDILKLCKVRLGGK
jgi:hypothetical protein